MTHPSKPRVTGSSHPLPFERLSAQDFERLCLWLVRREGFTNAEYLGEAGSEGGRDVVAWKDGRRFVFQCKRVQAFTPAHAKKEIEKLRKLPVDEQPDELVFVVSRAVSAAARKEIRAAWGDAETCQFWARSELDERAKQYPDLVNEFFQLPVVRRTPSRPHNLPFPSLGSLFQGREDVVTLLRKKLTSIPAGRATAIAGKSVHGLGGVGKTRLAVEYAWRYAEEYTAVLFVGSESPADLRRNLAALCDPTILDLPEQEATEEEIREDAVLRWLNDQPGWLLILDNVDSEDAAVAVDALVARLRGGHVLLTGRLARWGAEIVEIELDVLTETAASEFLLARTKKRRPASDDDESAVMLACELGFLPLALEQACAYIDERRLTFAGYLEELKSKHDAVLSWFDPRVSRYPQSVAVTWLTTFDRLSEQARRLLERLAWLGPEPIPESLLDVPVPESSGKEDLREALVELASYSLVTRNNETPTFSVHQLVQDVTRGRLRDSHEALKQSLGWINSAFVGDPGDVRDWPILEPLVPHARAVSAHAEAAGITDPTARLLNQLGFLFYQKALPREAEPLMARAMRHLEGSLGKDHPNFATALNNLALLLQSMNRLGEAEPLIRRALDIDEKSFGSQHPSVAIRLNNLAVLLQATNRLSGAEPLMRRALDIDEKSFGPQHPNVAIHLNNLAALLQATNRPIEAEPLIRRALDIDEKSFGSQHPNVAIRLNNLAYSLKATNRLSEAEPLVRRALDIDEKSFGPEHPEVATDLNNLAQLLQATNRLSEAELLLRRALDIYEKSFGPGHPNVATALDNLARLLRATNRLSEAEPLIWRALDIDEKSFGPQHPNVAIRLNNLASLLQATNRLSKAEPLMRRCVLIVLDFTRRTGHEHPHLRDAFASYAALLKEMGKSDEEIKATLESLAQSPE